MHPKKYTPHIQKNAQIEAHMISCTAIPFKNNIWCIPNMSEVTWYCGIVAHCLPSTYFKQTSPYS
jgi:hypothetical protein